MDYTSDECNKSASTHSIILSSVWVACITVSIPIFLHFGKQICKKENKIVPIFQGLSITCIIIGLIASIFSVLFFLVYLLYCNNVSKGISIHTISDIVVTIAIFCYQCYLLLISLLFILRLKVTFENSTFAQS